MLPMLYQLRRHPFPVEAHFEHCLVLTYAFPADVLRPLVRPMLELETFGDDDPLGMLAIALVQTNRLRPAFVPRCLGQGFFLSGYRIFTRLRTAQASLRGLQILRSDTNRRLMRWSGNLLTHYNYRPASVRMCCRDGRLECQVGTRRSEADLHVIADLSETAALPAGSCLSTVRQAARFAGPLPYTFDYEPQTGSTIIIRARRQNWRPRPVSVDVRYSTFLTRQPFLDANPILAAAFYVSNIDYRWERGRCVSPGSDVA
jgi:hypothetical protein